MCKCLDNIRENIIYFVLLIISIRKILLDLTKIFYLLKDLFMILHNLSIFKILIIHKCSKSILNFTLRTAKEFLIYSLIV